MENFSQDLHEILQELGWNEPIRLLGHSMGGRIALQFAAQYPQLVKQLVIVDIGPTSDWASMGKTMEMIASVPVPFPSRGEAKTYLKETFSQRYGNMMADFFMTNLKAQPGDGEAKPWSWRFDSRGIQQILENSRTQDYWDLFHKLSVPTLLLRGEKSTYLLPEEFSKVQANNDNIQGVEILGAGHWLHAEQPVATLKALKEFFLVAANLS